MEDEEDRRDSKRLVPGPSEYLSRDEFILEMARVASAFPHFSPTELTWQTYWDDLHWIPAKNLRRGLEQCRTTGEFFPAVSKVIENSIGRDYGIVKYNPHGVATVRDIARVYKEKYERERFLLIERRKREIPGKK